MDEPKKTTPDRPTTQDRRAFLLPVPRDRLIRLLRKASHKDGFTDDEARVSVLLDVDAGRAQTRKACAKRWGWTYKKVRYRWDAIWQDVAEECASYGRQMDSPLVARLPPEWQRYLADKYGAGAAEGPTGGAPKDTPGAPKTPKTTAKTAIRGNPGATERQPVESPGATQGHWKGNRRAPKTPKTAPKTTIRGNAGATQGQSKGNGPSHNARARHPLPLPLPLPFPKDLSNAAAAFTTLDSSEIEIEMAAAAALLDLDSKNKSDDRTADAEILSFCQTIGVSQAEARRIAQHEDAAYVHAQIASYKAAKGAKGPGWFVRAVEEGYDLRGEARPAALLAYKEAVKEYWRQGGGESGPRFDKLFECVKTDEGLRWRLLGDQP